MSVKSELLVLLAAQKGQYISGEMIGEKLSCTRAAIWKAVKSLREEGYTILSKTNSGYALAETSARLCADGVRAGLDMPDVPVTVLDVTASTNREAKRAALEQNAPHGTVIAARCQTEGCGRKGKTFYSPAESGLYVSVLIRPEKDVRDSLLITTAAAVAACLAVEEVCQERLSIKWVNDLYLDEKKVGGILTEAVTDFEGGTVDFAVVGIGLNLYEPKGGFPAELSGRAGAILHGDKTVDPNLLTAAVVNRLLSQVEEETVSPLYLERNIVPGRQVRVVEKSGAYEALAKRILPDGRLVVQGRDGKERTLTFGDVSLLFTP